MDNGQGTVSPGEGRPTAAQALAAVHEQVFNDDRHATTIVIRMLASGEVPYRIYERDGGEYDGGVATVEITPN